MLQENVLLVGGTEKSRALLQALIPPGSCAMSRMCQSGGEARLPSSRSDPCTDRRA